MNSQLLAVQQAQWIFEHHKNVNTEQLVNWAREIAEHNVYSNRHISSFTGLHASVIAKYTKKTDKTGGRLNPEALPLIAKLIQAPLPDSALIVATLDAGVSAHLLARLTGLSQSTLSRKARAYRAAQC